MHERFPAALLAAGVILIGLSAAGAEAAVVAPEPLSAAAPPLIVRITNICGANGCVRVQTQRVRHQKPANTSANRL